MPQAEILTKVGRKVVSLNRRKAVHEKCLECCCWMPGEVSGCVIQSCPLFPFRTGRGGQDSKARSHAIRAYCLECAGGQKGEVAKCASSSCALFIFRQGTPENHAVFA
jgi:hypothetical protein